MKLFDYLFDIINFKQNKISEDVEYEKDFQPFIIQRWLSMYSPSFAMILNNSTNPLWSALEEKSQWYKLFTAILPKSSRKRIRYIKKGTKKADGVDKQIIQMLASSMEISEREIKELIEMSDIDLKLLKKQLGITK